MLRIKRRGTVLIYTMFASTAFALITVLSVDYGRAQLARTQLGSLTDSAARYAVMGVSNGTSYTKANWIAGQNLVDNSTMSFSPGQVEVGSWDPDTQVFTVGGKPTLAVRVTAARTIPTVFGASFGINSATINAISVARVNIGKYGLVGLDWITLSGNSMASYFSHNSTQLAGYGNIASNGNVLLGGSSHIDGNVHVGLGKTASGGTINGSIRTLYAPLVYPNGDATPYGPTSNNNNVIPNYAMSANSMNIASNKSVVLPAGHYFFEDFTLAAGGDLIVNGPATIYCYGTVNMSGNATTNQNLPGNLTIVMVPNPYTGNPPGSINVGSTTALYASIYAPQSAVTLSGTGDIYGSVVGKSVNMSGTSGVHYDLSLESNNGSISLVK